MNRVGGLAILTLAVLYGLEARSFNVRFVADPIGPKAFPFIASLLLACVGLYLVVRPGLAAGKRPDGAQAYRMATCGASLVLYALALEPLGFIPATIVEMTLLASLLGAPLKLGVLAAGGFATVAFFLFDRILDLPLPLGALFN